ncbi:MAG TPA: TetR family transcriptional regulator [Terriglobales bacterium]|nr:TetR family transcriptional regulator [Terriglobales bacterium]
MAARSLRADARRNRSRVLEAAIAAFAAEGLAVPVHEIARRAGVGTGTVSRHFPTKELLFAAIVDGVAERLVERARELAAAGDPGRALFEFLAAMVEEGAANRALSEAFVDGADFDVEAAASGAGHDVFGALADLLARAQRAGAVRRDVDVADLKALLAGCLARGRGDDATRARMVAIVSQGLRAS